MQKSFKLSFLFERKHFNSSMLLTCTGHEGSVEAVAATPDGKYAVSGGRDKTLRLWQLENGECLRIFTGHEDEIKVVKVTHDGRFFFIRRCRRDDAFMGT